MADIADIAQEKIERDLEQAIRRARQPLAPGYPGVCRQCGEHSKRLVRGACAPCRDKYGLG